MADDIVLSARLENERVIKALEEISKEADTMAERSRGSVGDLASDIQALGPALQAARNSAAEGKKVFVEGFTEGEVTAAEFNKMVLQLLSNLQKLSAESRDVTPVSLGPSESAARSTVQDEADIKNAELKYQRLGEVLQEVFLKGNASAREFATYLQGLGVSWAENIKRDAVEADKELSKLITRANGLKKSLEFDSVDVAENLKFENVNKEFENLEKTAQKLLGSTSEEAQRFGSEMVSSLDLINERWAATGDINKYRQEVAAVTAETNKFLKTFDDRPERVDLAKQLNTEQARTSLRELNETTKVLIDSSSQRAKNLGTIYRQMGVESVQAFRSGKITAKELNGELSNLENKAKADARALGLLAEEGGRANVSIWKLGLTMDRLGARGPATALRLVDTFKQVNPAAIAATVGIVALGVAIVKLTELFVNLAKEATKAFVSVTKEAIAVAGEFENLERQVVNLFKGNEAAATATLKRILDLSATFGVDLTESLAQIFLPLVDSFEQFERIGEIASTLMVAFDQNQETVARALKQAQAEQFVTLQRTFFLNEQQIDRIKEKQNELGNTEGLIAGLEEFLQDTGRQWDTYSGTIDRVIATFKIFKKQFLLAFGEPIKNEVVEILKDIIEWVDANKQELEDFTSSVGQIISEVVGDVGGFITDILNQVDTKKLDDLVISFADLGEEVENLINDISALTGNEFDPLIDGAGNLAGVLEGITKDLRLITKFIDFVTPDNLGAEEAGEATAESFITGFLSKSLGKNLLLQLFSGVPGADFIFKAFELRNLAQLGLDLSTPDELTAPIEKPVGEAAELEGPPDDAIDGLDEYLEALEKIREAQEELRISQERAFEDLFGEVIGKNLDEKIDNAEKRIKAAQELQKSLGAVKVDILDIDYADLDNELSIAEREIQDFSDTIDQILEQTISGGRLSEAERKALEIQIDFYRDLQKAAIEHAQEIRDLQIERGQDERDIAIENQDKIDDIYQDYRDDLIDIEIDKAKKIEEIEIKHRDRLLEIRKRYDFDAQEAARRNDAVALLRIRRRMELELELAQDDANQEKRDAERQAADKREELKRQLDREIRDQEIANQRKLRDLAQAYEDQVDALTQAYEDEINEINRKEAEKRQDLLFWLDEQLKDFRENWRRKLSDLDRNYRDEFKIVQKWEARIRAEQSRRGRPQGGGAAAAASGAAGAIGSGSGSRFNGGNTGSTGTDPNSEDYGIRHDTNPGSGQESVTESWREEAIQLATQAGNAALAQRLRSMTNANEIRVIMNWLRAQKGLPPRQHGGTVASNMAVMVGEKGPEQFIPAQAGIIVPNELLSLPSQAQQSQNITYNNQRSIEAPISLLDPSQLSPIQISIIKSIVTEEILKAETV